MDKKVKFGVIVGTTAICTIVALTIVDGALEIVLDKLKEEKEK